MFIYLMLINININFIGWHLVQFTLIFSLYLSFFLMVRELDNRWRGLSQFFLEGQSHYHYTNGHHLQNTLTIQIHNSIIYNYTLILDKFTIIVISWLQLVHNDKGQFVYEKMRVSYIWSKQVIVDNDRIDYRYYQWLSIFSVVLVMVLVLIGFACFVSLMSIFLGFFLNYILKLV